MIERMTVREIVRQFTPNWFTVTMGTGILFLSLNQFPVRLPERIAKCVGKRPALPSNNESRIRESFSFLTIFVKQTCDSADEPL